MSDIAIEISLEFARKRAAEAEALLMQIRNAHNLSQFEFTRKVRIAPWESPRSHPVLTLNTRWNEQPDRFLAMYLHEQMHWYLNEHRAQQAHEAQRRLSVLYPSAPGAIEEGALDDASVVLHLLVNWLELSALRSLIGKERALAAVTPPPVYPWCYATVLRDWDALGVLFENLGLTPIPNAGSVQRA